MLFAKILMTVCVFGLLIHFSCTSSKAVTTEESDKIYFGSFGGFAGAYQEYMLLRDGSLYAKKRFANELSKNNPLSSQITDQYFALLSKFAKEEPTIQDPGNMTYFLRLEISGKDTTEWIWGGHNIQPSQTIKILHRNLTSMAKEKPVVM